VTDQPDPHNQYSFLLRIWKDSPEGNWRASLKDLITLENNHFSDIGVLCDYLCKKARQPVWSGWKSKVEKVIFKHSDAQEEP
jgi:hypothetical protein